MDKRKTLRNFLLNHIEGDLTPLFLSEGFEPCSLSPEDIKVPELRAAFPLGVFKRMRGKNLDIVEFQLDKYAEPKFVLNVGTIPPEGIDVDWVHVSQSEAAATDASNSRRLYESKLSNKWFGSTLFGLPSEKSLVKSIERAGQLVPDVIRYLSDGTEVPNLRRL